MRECNDDFTSWVHVHRAWHWPIVSASRSSHTHRKLLPATGSLIHPVRSLWWLSHSAVFHRVLQITRLRKARTSPRSSVCRSLMFCVNEGHRYLSSLKYVEILRNLPVRSLSLVLIGIVSKLLCYIMERSVANDLKNFYFIMGYIYYNIQYC